MHFQFPGRQSARPFLMLCDHSHLSRYGPHWAPLALILFIILCFFRSETTDDWENPLVLWGRLSTKCKDYKLPGNVYLWQTRFSYHRSYNFTGAIGLLNLLLRLILNTHIFRTRRGLYPLIKIHLKWLSTSLFKPRKCWYRIFVGENIFVVGRLFFTLNQNLFFDLVCVFVSVSEREFKKLKAKKREENHINDS